MLSVSNTLGSSGASLSLETRVAVGAGVFAVSAAEASAPDLEPRVITPQNATPAQKTFAYNAVEFSYRSDFGKIILLQQNVETGQALTQVPTEYHLRQYAATQRQQRVEQQQKLYKGSGAEAQGAPQQTVVSAAPTEKVTVSTSAPAASPPASPAVASSAVAVAAPSVDITT